MAVASSLVSQSCAHRRCVYFDNADHQRIGVLFLKVLPDEKPSRLRLGDTLPTYHPSSISRVFLSYETYADLKCRARDLDLLKSAVS